jgi:hypothetical protein
MKFTQAEEVAIKGSTGSTLNASKGKVKVLTH